MSTLKYMSSSYLSSPFAIGGHHGCKDENPFPVDVNLFDDKYVAKL